jgi:ornithine cyclodeaminase/alanine dehydrogenase-like protein (mu-crystallin family)
MATMRSSMSPANSDSEGGVLFVSSEAAQALLKWEEVVGCIAEAYKLPHPPKCAPPRTVARGDNAWLRTLPAIPPGSRYFGAKLMGGGKAHVAQYVVVLFDRETSKIAALVDGMFITAYRTAATSGAALDRLAPRAPMRLAVLGSGLEAEMHVRAFAAVRPVEALKVFSPRAERREAFAQAFAKQLGVTCTAVDNPEEAVAGASVVLAAARSRGEKPILYGDWLKPGMVVISIGSTVPEQREIDVSVVEACDLIVCDAVEEVAEETGDMIEATRAGIHFHDKTFSLNALIRGEIDRQVSAAKIPMFKSVGNGVQDVAVAEHFLEKSKAAGLATRLPFEFSSKSSS